MGTDVITAPWRYLQEAGTKSNQGDQGIRNKVDGTRTSILNSRNEEDMEE
jgi:hypothetical protein